MKVFSFFNPGFTGSLSSGLDADAKAYLEAIELPLTGSYMFTRESDGLVQTVNYQDVHIAVDRFVRDLKGEANPDYSTVFQWDKIIAEYPLIGGSEAKHRFNIKNPDEYLITFYKNPDVVNTFNDGNGFSSVAASGIFADTGISCTDDVPILSRSMGYFSNSGLKTGYDMGAFGGGAFGMTINASPADGQSFFNGTGASYALSVKKGLHVSYIRSATEYGAYLNNTAVFTGSGTLSSDNSPNNICIGGLGNGAGVVLAPSDRGFSHAFVSEGLTEAMILARYSSVLALQTALKREI